MTKRRKPRNRNNKWFSYPSVTTRETNKSFAYDNTPWSLPAVPQNDEQLIHQLNLAKGFIGIAVKQISTKGDQAEAYLSTDRAWELLRQIRTAIEDLEPE